MKSLFLLISLLLAAPALASDTTTPGKITPPFPTIHNLAVEWQIEGDDNLNATCEVRYRVEGTKEWRAGLPLRRVPAGASRRTDPIVTRTNRLSGSIFDLEPDSM